MEPLRTVMFIDGRNFKYNLGAFQFATATGNYAHPYRLSERNFLWREFFLGILDNLGNQPIVITDW